MFLVVVEVSDIRAPPHTNTCANRRQDDVAGSLIIKAHASKEIKAPIDSRESTENIFAILEIVD